MSQTDARPPVQFKTELVIATWLCWITLIMQVVVTAAGTLRHEPGLQLASAFLWLVMTVMAVVVNVSHYSLHPELPHQRPSQFYAIGLLAVVTLVTAQAASL